MGIYQTYETAVDACTNAMNDILTNVTDFSNRVYYGNYKEITSYPSVLFTLKEDRMVPHASGYRHWINYDILIFYSGGINTPADDVLGLIDIVGKVWDQIEDHQNYPWTWSEVKCEFSFNRSKSLLLYIAHLNVVVMTGWMISGTGEGYFPLTLESREDDNSTANLGTIDIGHGAIVLPQISTAHVYNQALAVTFVPPSGYDFDHWEVTVDTLDNTTANPSNMTVKGSGVLTAVYKEHVDSFTVDIDSEYNGFIDPIGSIGTIRIDGGEEQSLPYEGLITAGNHTIEFVPPSQVAFDYWDSDEYSMDNTSNQSTTVDIESDGSIVAWFLMVETVTSEDTDGGNIATGTLLFQGDEETMPYSENTNTDGTFVVSIDITPPEGLIFDHWDTDNDGVNFTNAIANNTTFTLDPAAHNRGAVITAIFWAESMCPSNEAEVVLNSSFEAFNSSNMSPDNWTQNCTSGGGVVSNNDVSAHSGSYLCQLAFSNTNKTSESVEIEQSFNNVSAECIAEIGVWYRDTTPSYNSPDNKWVDILYSDSTYTRVSIGTLTGSWAYLDLLSYVTAGKKVNGIRVHIDGSSYQAKGIRIDDVTLVGNG